MAQSLGYSFAPTFENAELGKRGGSPVGQTQDAIQVLNFRLPKVVGAATANALSPLVGDERRGADFGGAVLQSVLRTVLGPDAGDFLSGSPAANAMSGSPVSTQGRDPGAVVLAALANGGGQIGDGGPNDSNGNNGGSGGGGGSSEPPSPYSPPPPSPTVVNNSPPPPSPGPPVVFPGDENPRPDPTDDGPNDGPGQAIDVTPNTPDFSSSEPPSWRDDKYNGGWGQDYQTF